MMNGVCRVQFRVRPRHSTRWFIGLPLACKAGPSWAQNLKMGPRLTPSSACVGMPRSSVRCAPKGSGKKVRPEVSLKSSQQGQNRQKVTMAFTNFRGVMIVGWTFDRESIPDMLSPASVRRLHFGWSQQVARRSQSRRRIQAHPNVALPRNPLGPSRQTQSHAEAHRNPTAWPGIFTQSIPHM